MREMQVMVVLPVLGGGFPGISYILRSLGTNKQPNVSQQWISNDQVPCTKQGLIQLCAPELTKCYLNVIYKLMYTPR